jgi:hypothetical protein
VAGMKPLTEVKKWPAEAKLKALHDTRELSEGDMGAYLRREELYGQQVAKLAPRSAHVA